MFIDFWEDIGYDNENVANDALTNMSADELIILYEALKKSVVLDMSEHKAKDSKKQCYSPYAFFPTSVMSGFGGCNELSCRLKRADIFSRFVAMFADRAYLHCNLFTADYFPNDFHSYKEEELFRNNLIHEISTIRTYIPLIKKGYAFFVADCRNLSKRDTIADMFCDPSFLKKLHSDILAAMHLYCVWLSKDQVWIEINNVDQYIPEEHFKFLGFKEKALRKFHLNLAEGQEIDSISFKKFIAKEIIVTGISECFYTSQGAYSNHAHFITRVDSDVKYYVNALNLPNKNFYSPHRSMEYSFYEDIPNLNIPFLENISLDAILKLRELEGLAFENYRSAFITTVKEYCQINNIIDSQAIYDDVFYPAFSKLNESIRHPKLKNLFGDLLISSGIIAVGYAAGAWTSSGAAYAAMTGVAYEVGKQMLSVPKNTKNKENFYFLWKLQEK